VGGGGVGGESPPLEICQRLLIAFVAPPSSPKHDPRTHACVFHRYYAPRLAGKTLTKKLHAEVAAVFVDRFGSHAGWAHSVLFISDLRQTQQLLADADAL